MKFKSLIINEKAVRLRKEIEELINLGDKEKLNIKIKEYEEVKIQAIEEENKEQKKILEIAKKASIKSIEDYTKTEVVNSNIAMENQKEELKKEIKEIKGRF